MVWNKRMMQYGHEKYCTNWYLEKFNYKKKERIKKIRIVWNNQSASKCLAKRKTNQQSYLSWYVKVFNTLRRTKVEYLKNKNLSTSGFTNRIIRLFLTKMGWAKVNYISKAATRKNKEINLKKNSFYLPSRQAFLCLQALRISDLWLNNSLGLLQYIYIYIGSISSLIQISLNITYILCLHIFFWIRSNSRITFILFGRNWFMYCP